MRINVRKTAVTAAAFSLVEIGVLSAGAASARANQVQIGAAQDATLLGGSDATTNQSLADPGIFVGTDGEGNPKRGLIEFNIAGSIPAGATITGVTLQMTVGQVAGSGGGGSGGTTAPETISLYNESQAWGQPTNIAGATTFGGTGHGAAPDPGDATWNYAFYSTTPWTTAGGDWTSSLPDLADTAVTGTLSSFSWSSAAMVTDVQNWLNNPSANFGWIIKNADETDIRTFRAFWSAQGAAANDDPALAPQLTVTYTANPPATAYWSGAAGLVWATQPNTNWSATDGGADLHQIPGGGVTNVLFGATGNSAGTLSTTLGADFSINSLTFTSARTNPVIIGGANTLTLFSGGITVQSGSGAHTIDTTGDSSAATPGIVLGASQTWTNNSSNPFTVQSNIGDGSAGYALTIAGRGVIQLAGANTFTGGTIVNGGNLIAGAQNALPKGEPLTINSGGTVQIAANTGGGIADGATGASQSLAELHIDATSTLDITNNHITLLATGTSATDPNFSTYLGFIRNRQIISTTNFPGYGIGLVDGNDDVHTSPVAPNTIEIAYTLEGDANLDGKVDASDFSIFAPNFGLNTTLGWEAGDFNYDGKVDASDFSAFAPNFGLQDNGADVSLPPSDYAALDAFAAANGLLVDVPEPKNLWLFAIGAPMLVRRARHRVKLGMR